MKWNFSNEHIKTITPHCPYSFEVCFKGLQKDPSVKLNLFCQFSFEFLHWTDRFLVHLDKTLKYDNCQCCPMSIIIRWLPWEMWNLLRLPIWRDNSSGNAGNWKLLFHDFHIFKGWKTLVNKLFLKASLPILVYPLLPTFNHGWLVQNTTQITHDWCKIMQFCNILVRFTILWRFCYLQVCVTLSQIKGMMQIWYQISHSSWVILT